MQDLDWGTIDVYTCIASCTGGVADVPAETFQPTSRYIAEHIELQEIPDLMIPPSPAAAVAAPSSSASASSSASTA